MCDDRSRVKNVLLVSLLVLLMGTVLSACSGNAYTIRVDGTPGLSFSGSYTIVDDSGRVEAEAVLGVVPTEYGVDGTRLSCSFHKEEAAGLLRVEIVKGGKVVNEAATSAEYGSVTLTVD
jgi:hypothetical protein